MKKMRRGFALAMASAMVLLTACGGSQGASGSAAPADTQATQAPEAGKDTGAAADTTAAAASGDVIKIGCPQPLTGTNALVGDTTVKAAQLAVKQINEQGGLLGRQVELVVYDDQASPEEAVKIATKLIEVDKVDVVCGSLISSCVLASGQFFEEAKIPCIGTGLSSTWMKQGWEYVFRACPNAGMGMPALAEYMKNLGITKIAIFQGQDDSSASGAEDMRNACKDAGIEVLTSETYVEGDTDYSGQIAKILNSNPQAVFTSTFSPTQAPFAKQLRQFGYEGLVFNKETLSVDMNGHSAESYTVVWLFKTAIEAAGSTDGEAVKNALAELDIQGEFPGGRKIILPYDRIKFENYDLAGETHYRDNTSASVAIAQIQDGEWKTVWPFSFTETKIAYPAPLQ